MWLPGNDVAKSNSQVGRILVIHRITPVKHVMRVCVCVCEVCARIQENESETAYIDILYMMICAQIGL